MIPIKLALRNFMCYRGDVPPLSFEGIHTACISGDNGNGKSTLIDSMTWALWGKARAKSDDDLVTLGETEMEVEFDFAVGEQPYRILRKHARPKRRAGTGKTILELQIATDGGFRPLTGASITQTQQKISDILHMDYPTFTNSALLLQGRADEFTIKRPVERKQVLADILGLSFYDELAERARDRAKEREMERGHFESAVQDIDQELARKPDWEAELEARQQELAAVEQATKEQETRLSGLRQEKEALEIKQTQLAQLEERVAQLESDRKRWEEQAAQHRARLQEYEALIAQRAEIAAGYAQFSEAKKLSNELDRKLRLVTTLSERKHHLELAVTEASQALLKDHAVKQNQASELETSVQKLPALKKEWQQIQVQISQLSGPEEELRRAKKGFQELQTKVNYLESGKAQLTREIEELEGKLELLLTESGTKCPLCETELAAEGIKNIESKYTREIEDKRKSLDLAQDELIQKRAALVPQERDLTQREIKLSQDRASLQTQASILSQEVTRSDEARSRLAEVSQGLTEIEERLARRDFAPDEQESLRQLEVELAGLDYDGGQHEEVRQRLGQLEQYDELNRRLTEAEGSVGREKEAVLRAAEALKEISHGLEVADQQRPGLLTELEKLPRLTQDLGRAEAEYQSSEDKRRQAREVVWSLKARLERVTELELKRKETERRAQQAVREEKIYQDLAQAFGKRGIQALLIETVLPEIETEANELLARMTDNRMHLKIETQRETKSGSVVETLEIRIADELGTRNYEMFSGGEAFRINFALRIALSKLLARRAGAPLPTLVIDEGFGTQDTTGIEKIKETINSIQNDFEKILVITHIEELRDAFPTRINVIKTAGGSTLEVN